MFRFVILILSCILPITSLAKTPEKNTYSSNTINITNIKDFSDTVDNALDKAMDERNFINYASLLNSAFNKTFPKSQRKHIVLNANQTNLRKIFNVVIDYTYRVQDDEALSFAERIFSRMENRRWLKPHDISSLYNVYTKNRAFDRARLFRRKFQKDDLPEIPGIQGWNRYKKTKNTKLDKDNATRPVIVTTGRDHTIFKMENIDFKNYTGAVFVGHPYCHFSNNMLKFIGQYPEVASLMKDHTIWITEGDLTNSAIQDWNRDMPDVNFKYVIHAADWPEINYWGTPSLYFFKNSKLETKFIGWPKGAGENRLNDLEQGFKTIGLGKPKNPNAIK